MDIQGVKNWAEEHYNQGADVIVECWEDAEVQEFLDDCKHKTDAEIIEEMELYCGIWEEQRKADDYFSDYGKDINITVTFDDQEIDYLLNLVTGDCCTEEEERMEHLIRLKLKAMKMQN